MIKKRTVKQDVDIANLTPSLGLQAHLHVQFVQRQIARAFTIVLRFVCYDFIAKL